MAIIQNTIPQTDAPLKDINTLVEAFLVDDMSRLNEQQLAEFCTPGGVGEALVEAGKLGKKTLVRLSKTDDLKRRSMMSAMQHAKEKGDPLFDRLALNRVKEKELLDAIYNKYRMIAEKDAKAAQKEYIKTMRTVPGSFVKAGGTDR
ncbi:hypothetical protein [Bacteroides acidifaciens]|uniref:hypothetical protein n=1 Tax=Bacteroides acidifaciens TaxID=85831 RepID=UPI00263BACD1|nr:hypothetical protein [Bacteroides acidifaciens]